jgi:hypothetical protein
MRWKDVIDGVGVINRPELSHREEQMTSIMHYLAPGK